MDWAWHCAEGASRRSLVPFHVACPCSFSLSTEVAELLKRSLDVDSFYIREGCLLKPQQLAELCRRLPALLELQVRYIFLAFAGRGWQLYKPYRCEIHMNVSNE